MAHIRKRAGRSLGNQWYSHTTRAALSGGYHDPMGDTLCGAQATTDDLSWADTRWQKYRECVDCPECLRIRIA